MRSEIVLIVATLGLMPVATRAQESGGAVACPSIQSDQERLACYDRAMRGAPKAAPAAQASPPPVSAPAPAAATSPAAVAAPAVVAAGAVTVTAAAAAQTSSTVSTAPHNSRNKHAGSPPSPDAPPTIDPSTGQPTGIMPIVVLSTLVRPGFPIEFTTDRVGVWVQGEVKPVPALPKAPFDAQLEPGKFGGSFLVVPDKKLGIRVHGPER
jgi:hypothetical protein